MTQNDGLAHELRVSVLRLSRRVRSAHREAGSGLTESLVSVLATLDHNGPLTANRIAELERIRPASLSPTIARLEQLGLIDRHEVENDRRRQMVEITPAGVDELNRIRAQREQWLAERIVDLTPAQRDVLAEAALIMTKLAEA